ncbi:MAG TPA: nitrous oxide-stimulated promoter family protein [Anaerolineaceae bacterium]|nr:nitrous oxide-stimulated promoter family protein [Anaerolineaceae bacterium]
MKKNQSVSIESKIKEESSTLTALIELYCRKKHGTNEGLCEECTPLRNYAIARLERCIFLPQKPTCARCPVHCYTPSRRQQIRQVMRFSAPRFYLFRPGLAVQHVWQTFQRPSKKVQEVAEKLQAKANTKSSGDAAQTRID